MGNPLKAIAKGVARVGKWLASKNLIGFVMGNLPELVQLVEALPNIGKGGAKQAAAVTALVNKLAEQGANKDLLHHPRFIAWLKKANDITVEGHNLVELLQAELAAKK